MGTAVAARAGVAEKLILTHFASLSCKERGMISPTSFLRKEMGSIRSSSLLLQFLAGKHPPRAYVALTASILRQHDRLSVCHSDDAGAVDRTERARQLLVQVIDGLPTADVPDLAA